MYTHKIVDGMRVDLTPEEIAAREAQDAEWAAQQAQPAPAPTKEQLLAQLQALQAQIQALE
jgi:hypothetical protein